MPGTAAPVLFENSKRNAFFWAYTGDLEWHQLSLSEEDEDEEELGTALESFGAGLTFLGEGRQRSAG